MEDKNNEPGENGPQKNEEAPEEKIPTNRSQKGALAQGFNSLMNKKEINEIEGKINDLKNSIDAETKKRQKATKDLGPLKKEFEKWDKIKRGTKAFQNIAYFLAIITFFLFLFNIPQTLWAAAKGVKPIIEEAERFAEEAKKPLKEKEEQIKKINQGLEGLKDDMKNLSRKKNNIINRDLLKSNEKQRREEKEGEEELKN